MPRLVAPLLLALVLLLETASLKAQVLPFDGLYTIDVAPGWTMTQAEPGYMVFISPDQKAVFLVTTGLSLPKHRDKTSGLVKKYEALRLGSPDRFATLMRDRPKRVAVTILGDHPDRVKMYRSIKPLPGDKMREVWRTN